MGVEWTLVEGTTPTGESLIFEGQFIVAKVTRRQDAEEIVSAHNREIEAPEIEPL